MKLQKNKIPCCSRVEDTVNLNGNMCQKKSLKFFSVLRGTRTRRSRNDCWGVNTKWQIPEDLIRRCSALYE